MILTCPNCATRYQADAAKFLPSGRNVRCAKCGHVWHQEAPRAEPDPLAEEIAAPEPAAPPPPEVISPPRPVEPVTIARPQAYAPSATPVIARETATVVETPRRASAWPKRIGLGAGWLGLIAAVLLIGWAALTFRQQVVTVWPQSASVYAALGMKPKPSGLDIQDVAYRQSSEGGQAVLSVSGRLANTSSRELPVPEIRVGLMDGDNRELYHWTFVPGVMTLHPGEARNFSTRLTNPPEGARHFELRFAREGE
ncbi:MAG TPA: DUF3426 domain-containing protein [Rhizomicrobium sp.]|nr:DUF3426 domain-containing protein [Rhizomicrobium sp.]